MLTVPVILEYLMSVLLYAAIILASNMLTLNYS